MKYLPFILLLCFENLTGQNQVSNEYISIDSRYNLSRLDYVIKENKSFVRSHNIKEIYKGYNFNFSKQDTSLYSIEKYDKEGNIQSSSGKEHGNGEIKFSYFETKYLYDNDKKLIEFVKKKSWKAEQEVTKIEYNENNQVSKVISGKDIYNFSYYPNGKLKQCNNATNYYDKSGNLLYQVSPDEIHDTTDISKYNDNNCCVYFEQKHMHYDSMIVDSNCNILEMYFYNFNDKYYLDTKTIYKYTNGKLTAETTYTTRIFNNRKFKIKSYTDYIYYDNGLLKNVIYYDKNKKVYSTQFYSYSYFIQQFDSGQF